MYSVHQPVDRINPPAPVSMPVVLQGFRLADALMPVAVNIKQKLIYPAERLFVLSLPVQIVFPCLVRPYFMHRKTQPNRGARPFRLQAAP